MAEATPFPSGSEVLLLEDDSQLRRRVAAHLRGLGGVVSEAARIEEARRLLKEESFDFALMDLHLPDGEAITLLREGLFSENTGVVVMTAFGGIKKAVEAMRLGAGDYLSKPFELDELPLAFGRCRMLRGVARRDEHRASGATVPPELFFGRSLQPVREQLDAILAAESRLRSQLPPVLIEGETGTGKSVLARWLHRHGPRSTKPFVAVNCASLPENLAESELFGHERGAFTDAKQARIGLFEAADGGTLFLDEIGSLSPGIQAKVLVAVEEGKLRRVGATKEIGIDVHILSATNRPLAEMVSTGEFRDDLFHRLDLLRVTLPPLRERGSDIIDLARHLLAITATRHRLPHLALVQGDEARLLAHDWPGNVRELAHELERATIFSNGERLDFSRFGGRSKTDSAAAPWRNPSWRLPQEGFSLDAVISDLVAEALAETDDNVSAAARRLGVTREFLRYRLSSRSQPAGTQPPAAV